MTTSQKNPKMDWGFYAVTPRIVRTQYKHLSHAEKWLYTCLKDLCGDKGTCFRTLRSLKEETDISIASLSTMIPRLHAAGLIHAEKKRRSNAGKEVWHISIVDIWQLNNEHCSNSEQSKNENVQNLNEVSNVVQPLNNIVQNLNEKGVVCSENERVCSKFSDRRITHKDNNTEERTDEEESAYSNVVSDDQQDALASAHTQTVQDEVVEEPYQPDFTLSEIKEMSPVVDAMIATVDAQQESIRIVTLSTPTTQSIDIPAEVVPAQGYTQAEQATLTVAAPRRSAVMKPCQPRTVFSLPELSPKVILDAQIDQVLGWLDTVRIEAMKDARAGYVHTQTARKDIKGLIEGGAHLSQESVRANYLNLYNQPPDKRTGWDWKKKLTIRAFCNNFDNAVVCVSIPVPQPKQSGLLDMTDWTDDEYTQWQRTGIVPQKRARRA